MASPAQLHIIVRRLLVGLCGVLVLTATPTAMAHARLTRSLPVEKTALDTAPQQIELWFNELLDHGFNHVVVFPASEVKLKPKERSNFADGKPEVDAADRTHLTVKLKPLPAGDYVVEYRVLSRDGHTAPGRVRFTVRASQP